MASAEQSATDYAGPDTMTGTHEREPTVQRTLIAGLAILAGQREGIVASTYDSGTRLGMFEGHTITKERFR
jgi:hypothetical protein